MLERYVPWIKDTLQLFLEIQVIQHCAKSQKVGAGAAGLGTPGTVSCVGIPSHLRHCGHEWQWTRLVQGSLSGQGSVNFMRQASKKGKSGLIDWFTHHTERETWTKLWELSIRVRRVARRGEKSQRAKHAQSQCLNQAGSPALHTDLFPNLWNYPILHGTKSFIPNNADQIWSRKCMNQIYFRVPAQWSETKTGAIEGSSSAFFPFSVSYLH